MGYDKVFTKEAFARKLIHIATELDTQYNNNFPYNCGYVHENGKVSWDCWNMPKSLIWGWQEDEAPGYYCYQPGLYGLDDLTGGGIMAVCDGVSGDFSKVIQSEFLLTADKKHAGMFVDEFADRLGQLCNVVECTTSWNEWRVIGSWVDPDGTRRNCKGGIVSKAWAQHGQLPWIDYGTHPVPPEPPKPKRVDEDGWWGREMTFALQDIFGCQIMDAVVSRQPNSNRQFLANASVTSWEFRGWPFYSGGSALIKAMQAWLGIKQDGWAGYEFVGALQQKLKDLGFYTGLIDHSMGPGTVLALQRWVNAQ